MSQTDWDHDKYYYWTDYICKFDTVVGIPSGFRDCLWYESWRQDKYSKPMPWIGIYIAVASLVCILAMVADLIHGLRSRKLWFPCKYFTLNAASLTVIAVAMKLPVDLSNPMRGVVDQWAKHGSMAFMCTMMANLLPSLATMNGKELLTNIIALDILVITLIVNVCIQLYTDVVGDPDDFLPSVKEIAYVYVALLFLLLIIQTCSGLTILKSKQIIELKYQAGHETALKDLESALKSQQTQPGRLNAEMLKQHVINHWIMAGTGSPQFITACSATTSASGVICVASTVIHVIIPFFIIIEGMLGNYLTHYKESIPVILIIQCIGSLVGTIAPLCRCYAALSFKLSIKWIWNQIKVFKVESYWTQKLYDWKQSRIPISVSSRKTKIFIHKIKVIFLIICIGLQMTVVVACKITALVPIFIVICVLFCVRCWKWFKPMFSASSDVTGQNLEQESFDNLKPYVLQLQDDMELSERTLKSISKSANRLIEKAKKQPPSNLVKLLGESKGFERVGKYDSPHVLPLFKEYYLDYLDCWSLPLVTLTAIAVSLRKIQNDKVDGLRSSVSEGLTYVTLVEESLNAIDDKYVRTQKAAELLWQEVEVSNEWLGNNLKKHDPEVNTKVILEWFNDEAKKMVAKVQDIRSANDPNYNRSICANSMYRITKSILSDHSNINELTQEQLFKKLSLMIADILAACLTNLPQVIVTKCHESVIEKRVSSVNATVQLLGETTEIIENLQVRVLPAGLDPADLPFIGKWRDHFNVAST